jgi:vacuolar-type H+-ATPase subunit E/Vma4
MSAPNIKEGLSAIAREVLSDMQRETEALIRASEKDAKRILRAAKEDADKSYSAILDEATAKSEAEKRRMAALTEVEMRNILLQTKELLVDMAFEKAWTKLNAFIKTEGYHRHLLKLIESTAKEIGSKNLIITVNARDKAWLTKVQLSRLSKRLNSDLTLSDETGDYVGGCKIETLDGKIVFDNSIDNRLQELKPALRVEVAKILFGEAK